MSLPNDDDDGWGQRIPPFGGKGDSSDFYKDSSGSHRIFASPSEDATAAETSVGSNSVISAFTTDGGDNTSPTQHSQQQQHSSNTPDTNSMVPQQQLQQLYTNPAVSLTVEQQRQRYIRQLQALGVTTGATFALSVVVLIPAPVLLSMMAFLLIAACFLHKLYQVLAWELQLLVQGRGVGDYLPAGVYEQLTETSFHDFMSDTRNSYVNENAYLMLYMIPGLSRDQINEYVGRLSPRHQELLHRHGMGYFLGTSFMRFIMGDERLPQQQQQQQQQQQDTSIEEEEDDLQGISPSPSGSMIVPRRLELPPTIPEGASEDDESVTSELGHEDDPATQFVRHWGFEPESSSSNSTPAHTPPPSHIARRQSHQHASSANSAAAPLAASTAASLTSDAPIRGSSEQQQPQGTAADSESTARADAEAEEQVIYDAIGSAVATYMGVAANMAQTSARRSATLFSGTIFRASMSITVLGVGVGIYGFWTGTYNPQTFFQPAWQMLQSQVGALLRPPRSLQMPQSEALIGTTIASGATAGIMLLFQLASAREDEKERQQEQNGCNDEGNNKKRKGASDGYNKKPRC